MNEADFIEGFRVGYRAAGLRASASEVALRAAAEEALRVPEGTSGSMALAAARELERRRPLGTEVGGSGRF